MKKSNALAIGWIATLTLNAQAASEFNPNVIYGEDNRLDYYQVQNSSHLSLADSTVALVQSRDLEKTDSGYKGKTDPFTQIGYSKLCSDEPFYNQPTLAFCSGFLVKDNVIVTAGHCVESEFDCQKTNFVFDFHSAKKDEYHTEFSNDQVYSCKKIIKQSFDRKGNDFAVIELDRSVSGRTPLELNSAGDIQTGDQVGVIGYPSGLPVKVAFGGIVRSGQTSNNFKASLDTYGGNSGSAVLNEKTGKVEGILVTGERDFVYDGARGCTVSNRCTQDGCSGEGVTKISLVLEHLNSK